MTGAAIAITVMTAVAAAIGYLIHRDTHGDNE